VATVTSNLTTTPLALEAVTPDTPIQYHATDLRQLIGAVFPRYGRLGPGDALMLYPNQAGANWSVDVQAGWAIFATPSNPTYAAERYLITVPTRTNLSLTTFNLNPAATRTHKVYLVLYDKAIAGSGYSAALMVTEDTGSGAPAPTAGTYANYAQLGTVTITTGQSNIGSTNVATTLGRAAMANGPFTVTYLNSMVGGDGAGGPGLQYSLIGNTVRFQGNVKPAASGAYAAGGVYVVANVPVGYRPTATRVMLGASSGPTLARILVGTTGDISVTPFASNASNMSYVSFDGVSYEIN